jgi:hypothetical protein
LVDSSDKRLFTILLPRRCGSPVQGDTIWVISAGASPTRALAAAAFE